MKNIYEQVDANKWKSAVVVVIFTVVTAVSIYFISMGLAAYFGDVRGVGGVGFVGVALIISGLMSFTGYWFSDKIVLGISGARPADRKKDFLFIP